MQKLWTAFAPPRQTFAALGGAQAGKSLLGGPPVFFPFPPRGRRSPVSVSIPASPFGRCLHYAATRLPSPRSLRHVAYIPRCFFSGALKKTTIKTPPQKAGLQPPQGGVFTQAGEGKKVGPYCRLQAANCKTSKTAGPLKGRRFFYCTAEFISCFVSVCVGAFASKYFAFSNSF